MDLREELAKHGILVQNSSLTRNTVVAATCKCGKQQQLKIASILRTVGRVGHYRCLSCGMAEKHTDPGYRERQRMGTKESWTKEKRQKQSRISKALWSDPGFADKVTSSDRAAWADSAKRERSSEMVRSLWQDPGYRARFEAIWSLPAEREARAERASDMWQDSGYRERQEAVKASPEHRALQSRLAVQRWQDPEYRQLIMDSQKELWSDPAVREALSDRVKELWQDPGYREKQRQAAMDPELCKIKSENAKRQWQNSETRVAIIKGLQRFLLDGKDSILERTAQIVLDALQVPYVRHHVIGYFEFDLFVPSHGLLIECQGEYWHSLRKDRDAAKFTYVDTYFPEYRVLYLWERDFFNPGIIKQKLVRELVGENSPLEQFDFSFEDVAVRRLDVRQLREHSYYSAPEEFLQSFHYAGYGRSAKAVYGAYLGDALIGVCKFAPPIRDEAATSMGFTQGQVLELDRFCLHPQYQRKNFASWLVSRCARLAFIEYPAVAAVYGYADSTFGHSGTIYRAANWTTLHTVRPDYHYVSQDGFVIHKKTLYDHARRNGRREAEYASEHGYLKVFGQEKVKFALHRHGSLPSQLTAS